MNEVLANMQDPDAIATAVEEHIQGKKFGKNFSIGSTFRIDNNKGTVLYINSGKKFITAKLNSGELPVIGKTFMFEGNEYKVSHVNMKKNRFSFGELEE